MKGCRALADAEYEATLAAFRGPNEVRDRTLFVLAANTGFRIAEILSLRVRDVFRDGAVVDRLYVARDNRKGKKEGHQVALRPEASLALAWHVAHQRTLGFGSQADFLFQSRSPRNTAVGYELALRALKRAFARAGIVGPPRSLGWHVTRKTFAAKVYGVTKGDFFKTSKILGHKSPSSTASYLAFVAEEADAVVLAW